MLNSLLIVGLLTMGVGAKASTPINLGKQETTQTQKQYKQRNYENPSTNGVNYTITPEWNNKQFEYNEFETEKANTYKYWNTDTYNTALNIKQRVYEQQRLDYVNSRWDYPLANLYNENWNNVTTFTYVLTPNARQNNVTFTYKYDLALIPNVPQVQPNGTTTYVVTLKAYTSTNEAFLQYTNWGNNWDTYQKAKTTNDAINNGDGGWDYNTITNSTTFTQDFTNPQTLTGSTSIDIEFVNDRTNYVILFAQIGVTWSNTYNQNYPRYYRDRTLNDDTINSRIFRNDTMTLTGTYYPDSAGYEVVDIPGLMWEILTMPFSFISVAFNLTLFPGTPYSVNISQLFFTVIGILIFIFIVSIIRKRF